MPLSPTAIDARARSLRLLLFDVDGVLTDGSEPQNFFIRDGAAMVWARRSGVLVGFLSGRVSEATNRRAAELDIPIIIQGAADKALAYNQLLGAQGLRDEEVAFMGDDLMDLPALARVGLSAAPADAATDVRDRVHWVSRYDGGRGAARELIELVLRAQGRWDPLLHSFLT